MNYIEAIEYLERLNVFGIKPGLERIEKMLARLGNPQSNYKTIHVAGTNGKGSVCAMLSEILSTAGIKTGLFTSPHLSSYRERFRIDGKMISEIDFAVVTEKIKSIIDRIVDEGGESPTQFEALTAMAFEYFSRANVEYAVIETGLGGTLDSTNVITPVLSIITNVDMDHADKCGGTLEGIAHHKAGIIKRGIPIVTGAKGEPLDIIRATAKKLDAPIKILGEDFSINKALELALDGDYQRENAAVAVNSARSLDDDRIQNSTIVTALKRVQWEGRFEYFTIETKTVIIDGAHNPAGARALRESLDVRYPTQPRKFLFGVLRDKAFDEMIDLLFRPKDFVIVTRPESSRAAEPQMICDRLSRRSIRSIPIENIEAAFDSWIEGDKQSIRIAAGSLYMIGAVRNLLMR